MKVKKFLIEAFCGFVLWTGLLTPYMIFVMATTVEQYLSWIIMQAVVVPPVSVAVINITNKIVRRLTNG
jgi:membrane protein DedA with SNARE-associated domain